MSETQYGTGLYASAGYKNAPNEKLHYYALKKLFPIQNLEGELDNDLDIEGKHLDILYLQWAMGLYKEFFADTIDSLADDYARCWALSSTDLTNRQNELVSKMRTLINKNGRLNKIYYESIGTTLLGQAVTVSEGGSEVFRVGTADPPATPLPHTVYDYDYSMWTWTVTTVTLSDVNLQATFEKMMKDKAPAFTLVAFVYT